MKQIYVVGDSHTGSLMRAAEQIVGMDRLPVSFLPLGPGNIAPFDFYQFDAQAKRLEIVAKKWEAHVFPKEQKHVETPDDYLFAVCLPFNTARFLRDYNWGDYVHWSFKDRAGQIPLSDAVVDEIILRDIQNSVQFVRDLGALGLNVAVLDSPRFFAHSDAAQAAGVKMTAFLTERFRSVVSDLLAEDDIPVIAQPAQTITAEGATDAKFRHKKKSDQIHTNEMFGAIMLAQLLEYCYPRVKSTESQPISA